MFKLASPSIEARTIFELKDSLYGVDDRKYPCINRKLSNRLVKKLLNSKKLTKWLSHEIINETKRKITKFEKNFLKITEKNWQKMENNCFKEIEKYFGKLRRKFIVM